MDRDDCESVARSVGNLIENVMKRGRGVGASCLASQLSGAGRADPVAGEGRAATQPLCRMAGGFSRVRRGAPNVAETTATIAQMAMSRSMKSHDGKTKIKVKTDKMIMIFALSSLPNSREAKMLAMMMN